MILRDYLLAIAEKYDRHAEMSSEAQRLLRDAPSELGDYVPAGVAIAGSGGVGTPTLTPWVRFYDPDESPTPAAGVYLYYLFDFDGSRLWLTLSQGITALSKQFGAAQARDRLRLAATAIREGLGDRIDGVEPTMNVEGGFRQAGYAAGTIAALWYPIQELPTDQMLAADLDRMLSLCDSAVAEKRRGLVEDPQRTSIPAFPAPEDAVSAERFKPKSGADYVAEIERRSLTKSRRHEVLVREYGEWALAHGFSATTPHPRDLVLRAGGVEWLVEAKVVYAGDATAAVRAAIGQLLTYRYFFYPSSAPVLLLALFTESVGEAYVECLDRLAIAVVWREGGSWSGSSAAVSGGVAEAV
jgi:hypothetical protein